MKKIKNQIITKAISKIEMLSMYQMILSMIDEGKTPKSLSMSDVDKMISEPENTVINYSHVVCASDSVSGYGKLVIALKEMEIYFGMDTCGDFTKEKLEKYTERVTNLKVPTNPHDVVDVSRAFAAACVEFDMPKWVTTNDMLRMDEYEHVIKEGYDVFKTTHKILGSPVEYWIDEDSTHIWLVNEKYEDSHEDMENWIDHEEYKGNFSMNMAYREADYLRKKLLWEINEQQKAMEQF